LCEERGVLLKDKKNIISVAVLIILIVLGVVVKGNAFEFISDDSYKENSISSEIIEESESIEETSDIFSSEPETTIEYVSESEYETDMFSETDNSVILESGSYTTPEDVAEYIHTFGTLPGNFITKDEAVALGWDKSKGNLWDVADGMSIGGDRFGNYEGLLPDADGRTWTECDVNYEGGFRGSERIIFSNDGLIFYTDDHYKTFLQLY